MLSKREWIAFAAGAEAFHTFSHIVLTFSGLPITLMSINVTPQLNAFAIIINGIITVGLFWWLSKTK